RLPVEAAKEGRGELGMRRKIAGNGVAGLAGGGAVAAAALRMPRRDRLRRVAAEPVHRRAKIDALAQHHQFDDVAALATGGADPFIGAAFEARAVALLPRSRAERARAGMGELAAALAAQPHPLPGHLVDRMPRLDLRDDGIAEFHSICSDRGLRRGDEFRRDLRDDGVSVGAQLSHSGGYADGERMKVANYPSSRCKTQAEPIFTFRKSGSPYFLWRVRCVQQRPRCIAGLEQCSHRLLCPGIPAKFGEWACRWQEPHKLIKFEGSL